MPCSPVNVTDVSEENIASIFRVKNEAKQETSTKQAVDLLALCLMLVLCLAFLFP
jgi:hypothetical protein